MHFFQADPTSPARYFCSHAGGVHAVGLPMVTKLAEMASGGAAADATLSCLQGCNSTKIILDKVQFLWDFFLASSIDN